MNNRLAISILLIILISGCYTHSSENIKGKISEPIMKKLAIIIFVLMAFSSGCIENPKVVIEKPVFDVKGRYETVSTPKGGTATEVLIEIVGEGRASHLGKSSFNAISTLNVSPPPPFKFAGTSTMIAANGDEIYTEFEGEAMPEEDEVRSLVVYHTIIGGTGRYKHAKGELVGTGISNASTGLGYLDIEGKISY